VDKIEAPSLLRSAGMILKSRVDVFFTWIWCAIVSCLVISRGFPSIYSSVAVIISLLFILLSVYTYNDLVDRDVDKINPVKKNRPIPSGKMSLDDARKVIIFFGILGFAMMYFLNIYSFIISLCYYFLFFIYSYPGIHLKKIFLIKEIVITSGLTFIGLICSYAVSGHYSSMVLFATLLFSIFGYVAQPAAQDTLDIESDRMQGVKTLGMVLSWKRKMQLLITGVLVIMTITPLTYVNFGFNMLLPIFVVAGSLVLLRFMLPITSKADEITFIKARKPIVIYMLSLYIAVIIGSLQFNIPF